MTTFKKFVSGADFDDLVDMLTTWIEAHQKANIISFSHSAPGGDANYWTGILIYNYNQ